MKKIFAFLLFAALAGCASNSAVLPSLEGKPRIKINAAPTADVQDVAVFKDATAQETFDFVYQGDILDALATLQTMQPQMVLLSPIGKPFPFIVSVNLPNTTLEAALRALGEKGGNDVDLILRPQTDGIAQVQARFNNPKEQQ